MNPVETRQRLRDYRNRWGSVSQFDVPKWLITSGIRVDDPLFRCLTVLFYTEAVQPKGDRIGEPARVAVSRETFGELTHLSGGTVSQAIRTLVERGCIWQDLTVRKAGVSGFGTAVYTLLGPVFDFTKCEYAPLIVTQGKRLLPGNGCGYVTLPRLVLSDPSAKYSLAKMKASESTVYLACLSKATRTNKFTIPTVDLLQLTDLKLPTIEKAFYGLRSRGLMRGKVIRPATEEDAGETEIELFNPATGQPIPPPMDDPAPGPGKRVKGTVYKAADVERLLRECLPGRYRVSRKGEMAIPCPFHVDRGRWNMSVSLQKGGVCNCFVCNAGWSFADLLARLRGVPVDHLTAELQALEKVRPDQQEYAKSTKPDKGAEGAHGADGSEADESDRPNEAAKAQKLKRKAVAVYPYYTREGGMIRWKERYDPKDFAWFHMLAGEPTFGMGPGDSTLYHQEHLPKAHTVVIVEGEKDADTVSELYWKYGHPVIGVTSGNSSSWEPRFAKLLKGKRVVVMPDDTIDGARYAKDVTDSLTALRLPYTLVTFRPEACKDVSDYMLTHTAEDLLARIDSAN